MVHCRHAALARAVGGAAPEWSDRQRATLAALLDVLWNLPAYERLTGAWALPAEDATRALTWAMGQLTRAIEDGAPPA